MGMRRRIVAKAAVAAVLAALAVGATGCAGAGASGNVRLERALQTQAADVAREIAGITDEVGLNDPADATQEYARRAEPLLATTGVGSESDAWIDAGDPDNASVLRLVGIEASDAVNWQEPVGALVFASRMTLMGDRDGAGGAEAERAQVRDLCLRVELDRWGPTAGWDDAEAIAPIVDCPAPPLDSVAPEPDTRPIVVVPANAEAVATEVLAAAGDATPDTLAAEITARLETPTGEREVAADVQVERDGDRISLAMGTPDDCLLLRAADGAVERLHVSRVQLQPGELGCSASTALASDEVLRAPH